ncbi:glucose-1-phosphate cytidylyltransferase [Candidatus Pacearchaeota archaeon CG10_big_fil_rev_8_21_14_0_10_35_13]|nr:MAG: glucose-1-phosphate cytidylyltransferase [Candidatus Pacearchaeota archaeon CG10_big_fil_rev_8_21_14_0_10_35_13]
MKCVIFCGGKGSRMGELTRETPKPLLMIGDKPAIMHIMDHYASYNIREFILCLGHKAEMFKEYFRDNKTEYDIEFVDTGEDTNKAQRLLKIKNLVGDKFFLSYGDDISNVNIKELIQHHDTYNKVATLTAVRLPNPYGTLETDDFNTHIITKFREKPLMKEWINGGYFVLSRQIFDFINEGDDFEENVLPKLANNREITAFKHLGFWKSMNTIKDHSELNDTHKSGKLKQIFQIIEDGK